MNRIFTKTGLVTQSILWLGVFMIPNRFVCAEPVAEKKAESAVVQPAKQKVEKIVSQSADQHAQEILSQPAEEKFEGQIDEASKELLSEMHKERTRRLYRSVLSSKVDGNPAAVKEKLDKLIDSPDITKEMQSVLYQERGMMSLVMRDFNESGKDLDRSISMLESFKELTPGQKFALANAHYGRGALSFYSGKIEPSLSEFDTALSISPTIYMHLLKCKALIRLGRYGDATKAYESGMLFSDKFKAEAKTECLALQKSGKLEKCE